MLRYDASGDSGNSAETLLKIWAYQAKRLVSDRLVGRENVEKFENMLTSVIRNDWSVTIEDLNDAYYVTWGSGGGISQTGNVPGSFGRPLGLLSRQDFKQIVSKGLIAYSKYRVGNNKEKPL